MYATCMLSWRLVTGKAKRRSSMRLSDYTDYSLRVLVYCARQPGRRVTIAEIADALQLSKNHLMKIVNDLAQQGVLETTRGRGGGIRLLEAAQDIRIGDVVRRAETDFRMVECFDLTSDTCTLTPTCRLRRVLRKALEAYLRELDAVTLADIAKPAKRVPGTVLRSINITPPRSRRAA